MRVGRVQQLWRYPVKSMQGDALTRADMLPQIGLPGDRGWAVRDEARHELCGAKRLPGLLQCEARYVAEPAGPATPPVLITLPGGDTVRSDDPAISATLSAALEYEVTLWPRVAADNTEHFIRRTALDAPEVRRQLGLAAHDPLPAALSSPATDRSPAKRFVTPPGTYFDAYELHLVSTATLDALRARFPAAGVDVRRYRPNVVIDTGAASPANAELDWVGRRLRVGGAVIEVVRTTIRCAMITHPQRDLHHDRTVLQALIRETGQMLGVAASVVEPGSVAVGDPVVVIGEEQDGGSRTHQPYRTPSSSWLHARRARHVGHHAVPRRAERLRRRW